MPQPISSPCQNICTLDPSGRVCLACKRRIEEIVQWGQLSERERQAIMAELPSRTVPTSSNLS